MSIEELPPRESMEFDVVIVGAGPSGLAAAIRLKQLNADLSIVVVEKGSEVGAHILSGAVIDPVSLDKLIPDWREDADCPLKTQVKDDRFYWTTATSAIRLPNFAMPPLMNNHHCYIGSLGNVCRWLGLKTTRNYLSSVGFNSSETIITDTQYSWRDSQQIDRLLTINIVSKDFIISSNYLNYPDLTPIGEVHRRMQ